MGFFSQPGVVVHAYIPSSRRLRHGDGQLEASLGYMKVKTCFKNSKRAGGMAQRSRVP